MRVASVVLHTMIGFGFGNAFVLKNQFSEYFVGQRFVCRATYQDDGENESSSCLDRRSLIYVSGKALASTILGISPFGLATPGQCDEPRTILITGSNSGIGYEAALKLASQGHKLILPCRSYEKSYKTVQSIAAQVQNTNLIPAECDLASLRSISTFVKDLPSLIGADQKLDTVCLNAGLARLVGAEIDRTEDGFERTVGTNHLGHFYLNHLLLPSISSKGRIVVTASGVHDPDSPGGAQGEKASLGNLEGFERDGKLFEMVDGNAFNADKAYKDSKLCNVFFTRELARRLVSTDIAVNCFNPGLIVSTGLFREQPKVFTKLFDVAATDLFKVGETPQWGGASLAFMTTVETKGMYYSSPPGSSKYGTDAFGKQFQFVEPSREARDTQKGVKLWELSEKLVGIA